MNKQAEVEKLEEQKEKLESQINDLKGNRFVQIGKRWGHKLAHKFHKHSFSEWKKNYVVLKRQDYHQLKTEIGFYQAKYRDAMLRSNNRNTNR